MALNNDQMQKLMDRLEQLNSKGNGNAGVDFITIKDGRNKIRVLPAKAGEEWFYREVWVHYGVGKTKDKKGVLVVCPTTKGDNEKCPICELSKAYKDLSKVKDDKYDKLAKSNYRKKRVYYNAINRDEDLSVFEKNADGKWVNVESTEPECPVKVLATGVDVLKQIIGIIVDPEYGDITDPEEGLDLTITKTGQGQFNTNYDVKSARKNSTIGFDEWEECLHDLSQFGKVKTYDEIQAILNGEDTGSDDSDNEDKDEAPPVKPDKEKDKGRTPPAPPPSEDGEEEDLEAEIKAALARRKAGKK